MIIATMCTKSVARVDDLKSASVALAGCNSETQCQQLLTGLEYQSASNIDIPAITRGLDALLRPNQRTYNESSGLADAIE
jgi:hypothetical protein